MLRLLLATAALLSPASLLMLSSPDDEHHDVHDVHAVSHGSYPYAEIVIRDEHLPKPNGWFLVPLTATQDTSVSIDAKIRDAAGPAVTGSMFLASFPGAPEDQPPAFGGARAAYWPAEVYAHPLWAGCCTDDLGLGMYGTNGAHGMGNGGWLRAGETAYVGAAVYGWGEGSRLKIVVTSYEGALTVGEPLTGTGVFAIDLVQAAQERGVGARIGGTTLVSDGATNAYAWEWEGKGALSVNYWTGGDDIDARLSVVTPAGTPLADEAIFEEGGVVAAHGQGSFRVEYQETRGLSAPFSFGGDYSYVYATMMFADVDLPGRSLVHWHNVNEDADW